MNSTDSSPSAEPTDEIRHTVLLAITTLGFPSTMSAMSWVEDVLGPR